VRPVPPDPLDLPELTEWTADMVLMVYPVLMVATVPMVLMV